MTDHFHFKGIGEQDITRFPLVTPDNVHLLLTRCRGGDRGPVLLSHGLGVSSEIFTTDAIDTSLAAFLYQAGYDVWLLDFRVSILLPASRLQCTGDDVAFHDYPAAVAKIRTITGARDIQVVAHCFGATTFIMSMLAGLQGVRSAVCSQVATHMVTPRLTRLKAALRLARMARVLGIDHFDASPPEPESLRNRLFDLLLLGYPIRRGERCSNPVCRRIAFMYAELYNHANLTGELHADLKDLFGVANISAFMHLATMVRTGFVVNRRGSDIYLPWLGRLNIPVTFIHGSDNVCFFPESTEISCDLLGKHNGRDLYHRVLVPGYGHIDCIFGRNAHRDVFPAIVAHLDATSRPVPRRLREEKAAIAAGLTFRERMAGRFEGSDDSGQTVKGRLSLSLAIVIPDLAGFTRDPGHRGTLTGTVRHPMFGVPVPADRGVFRLFAPAEDPETRLMVYQLWFRSNGTRFFLDGEKRLRNDWYLDLWPDSTTLFVTLYEGEDAGGRVRGRGKIRLSPLGLLRMMTTFAALNRNSASARRQTLCRFLGFFVRNIVAIYLPFLHSKRAGR